MRSRNDLPNPCANGSFRAACGLAIISPMAGSAYNPAMSSAYESKRSRFQSLVCKSVKHTFQCSCVRGVKPSTISHQFRASVETMCISKIKTEWNMRQIAALTPRITKLCDSEMSMSLAHARGKVEHPSGESRFCDRRSSQHHHTENKFRRDYAKRQPSHSHYRLMPKSQSLDA